MVSLFHSQYCCFAIPLYNVGIYAIMAQFAVIGITSGVLSFAAPHIIAVSTPSLVSYIFGAVCIGIGLVQGLGFFGVYREKADVFKKYLFSNILLLVAALILSLVVIIASFAQHSSSTKDCTNLFGDNNNGNNSDGQTGESICKIWTWVQAGIMGLLWVILGFSEGYFAISARSYSLEQRASHQRYNSLLSGERDSLALRQSGVFDSANDSLDGGVRNRAGHGRSESGLRNEYQYGDEGGYRDQPSTSAVGMYDAPAATGGEPLRQQSGSASHSGQALIHDPYGKAASGYPPAPLASQEAFHEHPTPTFAPDRNLGAGPAGASGGLAYTSSGLGLPEKMQNHPTEGLGGRKAPQWKGGGAMSGLGADGNAYEMSGYHR